MKLTKAKVAKIKTALTAGETQPKVAKKFNISRSTISDIATNRVHTDVEWPAGEGPIKVPGGQLKKLPEHDPTNARVQELEAEVVHLREERDYARKTNKGEAKQRGFFKAVVAEMDNRIVPFKALAPSRPKPLAGVIVEDLVMHMSDGHHDQIVSPEECGGLEEHNFAISCRRGEVFVDKTIDFTQGVLGSCYHYKRLTILAYGDHTSGEIHGHTNRSAYRNQFKNSFAIGQLHALMFRDLAPYFDCVTSCTCRGTTGAAA